MDLGIPLKHRLLLALVVSSLFFLCPQFANSANTCTRYLAKSGITRTVKEGKAFYFDAKGKRLNDAKTISRIESLNIPYVYKEVRISSDPLSHIQATAMDSKGRLQYRYHPKWIKVRSAYKFKRMVKFGSSLSKIHEAVMNDFARDGIPKEKVEATVVRLLEKSLIRVGNEKYVEQNSSYGLTTMLKKHVTKINNTKVTFSFPGKSGVHHTIEVEDSKIAEIIKVLMKKNGKELFRYEDGNGVLRTLTSAQVNAYIASAGDGLFSAKDFRTWCGTVTAADALYRAGPPANEKEAQEAIKAAMKEVAEKLHNTPSVAKENYVAPIVLESYLDGTLPEIFSRAEKNGIKGLNLSENAVIQLLK